MGQLASLKRIGIAAFALWGALQATACGTDNKAKSFTKETSDETAKKNLEAGNFTDAITDYETLIANDPSNYERYPLLASAYAGGAGIDIFKVVESQLGGTNSESLFDVIGSFVPKEPTAKQLDLVSKAVAELLAIPKANLEGPEAKDYASSALFQLALYQAAYAAMIVNKVIVASAGIPDLSHITVDDAEKIISNLSGIVAALPQGTLSEKAQATIDAIQSQPGATDREKIANYIASQQS